MKLATFFLIFVLLAIPFQSASAENTPIDVVRLTAKEVDGANDIEAAIITATEKGARPGTVILDGRYGPFKFTEPDKSLNLFISSITLRGENQASIVNCDDGLFFEGATIRDILIEGISFNCTGDGVEATGEFHDVILRKNTFITGFNGIGTRGASTGWVITDNIIQAGWDGIKMKGAKDVEITKNDISGNNGIVLLADSIFLVRNNSINASMQGIVLGQEACKNIIQANKINGVTLSGIAMEPGVTDNRILANKVTCAVGTACLAVDCPSSALKSNKINGNSLK